MISKLLIIFIAIIFVFINAFYQPFPNYNIINKKTIANNHHVSMLHNSFSLTKKYRRNAATLMSEVSTEPSTPAIPTSPIVTNDVDFSKYSVGQIYNGTLLSSKKFGVFVNIGEGPNVLLPKSYMSTEVYDKLTKQITSKSDLSIKIQLIAVSETNKTLSGKVYNERTRSSLDHIKDLSGSSTLYKGKVVSSHDFGVFVEIPELGVEGLVPASFLPNKIKKEAVKSTYTTGKEVSVRIIEVNTDSKKLVLSMKTDARVDVSVLSSVLPNKWLQGVVTSVSNFGLFVRPAGYDVNGLVYVTRIPKELISTLKKISPLSVGSNNKTDIENLFHEGDIVKVRVHSLDLEKKKIELSMLPFKSSEEDEDDYVIIEDEDEEKDGKKKKKFNEEDFVAEDSQSEDDNLDGYNPLDTLIWWKGQSFDKLVASIKKSEAPVIEEEFKILTESKDVVEGTWRRIFELDMREDEADFTSKIADQEKQELEDEIGELAGLDDELVDSIGFGSRFQTNFGSHIAISSLPKEWKEEIDYFKEVEKVESNKEQALRSGKKGEQSIFEALLKEIELDLEKSNKRRNVEPTAVAEEPVVEAAVETTIEATAEPTIEVSSETIVPPETIE